MKGLQESGALGQGRHAKWLTTDGREGSSFVHCQSFPSFTIAMKSLVVVLLIGTLSVSGDEKPLVIAHRGASGYLPEHTLPAVCLAYGMGADYIEQDVVLSKDRHPMVLHDVHIDTVTNVANKFPNRARADGRFYAVDFTLAELKTLSVNERIELKSKKQVFPKRFPLDRSQFRIAALEEELELIAGLNRTTKRNVGIYPEIKNPAWHRKQGYDISKIVVAMLQKHGYSSKSDKCFLQCFEQDELIRIRQKLGVNLALIQLLGDDPKHLTTSGLKKISEYADGIGPSLSEVLDKSKSPTGLVRRAHSNGLQVHPYTFRVDALATGFNDPSKLLHAIFETCEADGLFTDFPDVCIEHLEE